MKKFVLPSILALSFLSAQANADALGLYIGGGVWSHDPSGSFGTVGDGVIDMESYLKYSDESDSYVYAAFEHFVPFVPNIRLERASMGHTGVASGLDFNGQPGLSGPSSINIDNTDVVFYWRLLDNWVNFDLGLTARKLDADFTIGTETASVSETIPMLYLAAQFDLPLTGLSIGGDINTISYSGNTYQDVRLRALYEFGVMGIEVGLKSTTIELKDVSTVNADLEFKGMMVGAYLHF